MRCYWWPRSHARLGHRPRRPARASLVVGALAPRMRNGWISKGWFLSRLVRICGNSLGWQACRRSFSPSCKGIAEQSQEEPDSSRSSAGTLPCGSTRGLLRSMMPSSISSTDRGRRESQLEIRCGENAVPGAGIHRAASASKLATLASSSRATLEASGFSYGNRRLSILS